MRALSETIKKVLIPMFYKDAQLGRSLRANNRKFKKELFRAIIRLFEKADNSTLKNGNIRREIKQVSANSEVSIGQAQKVINVCLKYYCILTNKPSSVIEQLDCPLDSLIMSKFETKELKKVFLKDMIDFDVYIAWQKRLENAGNGNRLQQDIETYDKKRIEAFLL